MLQTVHKQCLKSARRHTAYFASEQCILVHFTKAITKHNSVCHLILPTALIQPSLSTSVLGMILDTET